MRHLRPPEQRAATILLTGIAWVVALFGASKVHEAGSLYELWAGAAVAGAGGSASITGFLRAGGAPLSRRLVWFPFFALVIVTAVVLTGTVDASLAMIALLLLWTAGTTLQWIVFVSEADRRTDHSLPPAPTPRLE